MKHMWCLSTDYPPRHSTQQHGISSVLNVQVYLINRYLNILYMYSTTIYTSFASQPYTLFISNHELWCISVYETRNSCTQNAYKNR